MGRTSLAAYSPVPAHLNHPLTEPTQVAALHVALPLDKSGPGLGQKQAVVPASFRRLHGTTAEAPGKARNPWPSADRPSRAACEDSSCSLFADRHGEGVVLQRYCSEPRAGRLAVRPSGSCDFSQ